MSWNPITAIRGMVSRFCSFLEDRWVKLYTTFVENPVKSGRTTVKSARDCGIGRDRNLICE
jgi:hypothetical protein